MEGITLPTIQEWVAVYGMRLIAAAAILFLGRMVAHAIRRLVGKLMLMSKVDETLVSFAASLTYVALMAFVLIAALNQLGVQTASFIAVMGAAGLAIGLALQGSLANFAAGVLLIVFKPFGVGDSIAAAGTEGCVVKIDIFTTELKAPDNLKIIVPNSKIIGDIIKVTSRCGPEA